MPVRRQRGGHRRRRRCGSPRRRATRRVQLHLRDRQQPGPHGQRVCSRSASCHRRSSTSRRSSPTGRTVRRRRVHRRRPARTASPTPTPSPPIRRSRWSRRRAAPRSGCAELDRPHHSRTSAPDAGRSSSTITTTCATPTAGSPPADSRSTVFAARPGATRSRSTTRTSVSNERSGTVVEVFVLDNDLNPDPAAGDVPLRVTSCRRGRPRRRRPPTRQHRHRHRRRQVLRAHPRRSTGSSTIRARPTPPRSLIDSTEPANRRPGRQRRRRRWSTNGGRSRSRSRSTTPIPDAERSAYAIVSGSSSVLGQASIQDGNIAGVRRRPRCRRHGDRGLQRHRR